MMDSLRLPRAEREILGETSLRSVTPWIIATMTFAIVLMAAAGLVIANAGRTLERAIESRYTLVVPAGSGSVEQIAARMQRSGLVADVAPVSETQMRRTLERWLGPTAQAADLPVPAMIDFDLKPGVDLYRAQAAISLFAPSGQVTSHADNVRPLILALGILQWVALALVVLLGTAAGAAVVLAARGALDSHRSTIEVLHGIGATDTQVTRLFVRRIALDTFVGSALGALAAGAVILTLATSARWAAQMGGVTLGLGDLMSIAIIPLLLTAAATMAARAAIITALGRDL